MTFSLHVTVDAGAANSHHSCIMRGTLQHRQLLFFLSMYADTIKESAISELLLEGLAVVKGFQKMQYFLAK